LVVGNFDPSRVNEPLERPHNVTPPVIAFVQRVVAHSAHRLVDHGIEPDRLVTHQEVVHDAPHEPLLRALRLRAAESTPPGWLAAWKRTTQL
jgi:hypothetical protein